MIAKPDEILALIIWASITMFMKMEKVCIFKVWFGILDPYIIAIYTAS